MYLASIYIENFKGIQKMSVEFQKDINVIIGENGCYKTALIDAIRLLYNLGNQPRDIYVTVEDFYLGSEVIKITYDFKELSLNQKGAFYEYLVLTDKEENDFARITLIYKKDKQKVLFGFYTGEIEGQKADHETFERFIHYYLGALRDSTRDLLTNRGNILGGLINRQIEKNNNQVAYEQLMNTANSELLKQPEVTGSKTSINANLVGIFKQSIESQIGLRIEESKAEYIVNIIKPYLPHDKDKLEGDGFNLKQNSLGFNNLIYIATVLGDINQQLKDDDISHYCLLIEEPEAHLHPQLQLSLFEFLKNTNNKDNSQLFITTHSPTLTSKVPLDNLILLCKDNNAINIFKCFEDREVTIVEDDDEETFQDDPKARKKQLERYIDVTKSQLFFSKGVLFVEGISEEMLIPVFASILNFKLEDYKIELVNADGTSFYPFIYLFNSKDDTKALPMPLSIITDDDRYTDSKDSRYSFKNIIAEPDIIKELKENIKTGTIASRIKNINLIANDVSNKINIQTAFKTFEFALIKENIGTSKEINNENLLWKFLTQYQVIQKKMTQICKYLDDIKRDTLSEEEQFYISLLIWKMLPSKAEFAQDLAVYLRENLEKTQTNFIVPEYIKKAIEHLVKPAAK